MQATFGLVSVLPMQKSIYPITTRNVKAGGPIVSFNEAEHRPLEAGGFMANCKKARAELGWNPNVKFKKLVKIMMKSDMLGGVD